jgi:GNAT superfamily N-acetyltransferase
MYQRSIYRDDCDFDEKAAKALLMRGIQRHGGRQDGSTVVFVAERAGVVEGFIIAALSRLYDIGTKLLAADTHFYCSKRAHARDAFKLIDAYDAWAAENQQVIEIDLCATDAIGEFRRTEKLYRRMGFEPFGVILSKRVNTTETKNV